MFPEDDDDMPAPIVGDVVVNDAGKIVPADEPQVAPVETPKVVMTPEGPVEQSPMSLQQINLHMSVHMIRAFSLTTALNELGKALEVKLRAAYEAGEDLTKYTIALIDQTVEPPKSKKK